MKPINGQDRRIANIHTTQFEPLETQDGSLTGQSVLQINDSQPKGVGFHIYKMAAGFTTDAHIHTEDEEFFILEGDIVDNDGTRYVAGDLVWLKKGTEHNSYSEKGCTLVVYIKEAEEMIHA
jgi:quercetin dioxygenase-like cupin family protein